MRVALLLFTLAVGVAHANPAPAITTVEVDLHRLDRREMRAGLTWTDDEPGGLLVEASLPKDWFLLGLKAGDVITRVNGAPVATGLSLDEGSYLFELVRGGRAMLLRTIVHGDTFRTVHLTDAEIAEILDDKKPSNPTIYAVPVKRGGLPTGARIITDVRKLELVAGDLVRTVGRARIFNDDALTEAVAALPVGHTDMVIARDGRELTITLEREPVHAP